MSAMVGTRKTAATTRSPRRPEKRLAIASRTPTITTNKPIASNIVRNLCVVVTRAPSRRSGERARRAAYAPDPFRRSVSDPYFGCPLLRPRRLDLVDGVLRALAGDPLGRLLPERVGTNGGRHGVGSVEAEDRLRVLQRGDGELVDVA